MLEPTAMVLRFDGDADDLAERFERARQLWINANEHVSPPALYVVCMTDEGIVVITGWSADEDHQAFREGIRPHLKSVGLGRPARHDHMAIDRLGWN